MADVAVYLHGGAARGRDPEAEWKQFWMRRRVGEAASAGHAFADGAWPSMEESRRLLHDYVEGHELPPLPEGAPLPEDPDPDPGEEDR